MRKATLHKAASIVWVGWAIGGLASLAFADGRYDASLGTFPQSQGWVYANGGNPAPALANNALQASTTVGNESWSQVSSSLNFSNAVVLQANLQISSSNFVQNVGDGSPRSGYYFCVQDQSAHSYDIGLSNGGFLVNQYFNQMVSYPLAGSAFHTYRFVVTAGLASLSIDGAVVQSGIPPAPVAKGCGSPGEIFFGGAAGASLSITALRDFCYSSETSGCACPMQLNVSPYGGGVYSLDRQPTTMLANFVPTDAFGLPQGLTAAAAACGFTGFNWQQTVRVSPHAYLAMSTQNPTTPLVAPFPDPPAYGYTYQSLEANTNFTPNRAYPFYWDPNAPESYPLSLAANQTDSTLSFEDTPTDGLLSPGEDQEFTTSLVGMIGLFPGAVPSAPLFTWQWRSTFTGTSGSNRGGISVTMFNNPFPADLGSGSGGVTITSINGVRLPAAVLPNQAVTTASGLVYSRVSQTFNGTVTVRNISANPISGPLQIVFFGVPPGARMVNATNNLSGTPYLTVSGVTALAQGQSVTLPVQFKNPLNAPVNLSPVVYSGSIN